MHIQYITDEKGKKTGVQLHIKEWNDLQKNIKKLEIFDDLKEAFKEMEAHTKGKLKTPTTKELLAQL